MAVAKGRESLEAREFKRYIGVAPVFIKAVNPNKAEHETLFNTTLDEAPEYVGKVTDSDGNEFANARVHVVLQPDTEKIGFEMPLISMTLFIQNRPRVGSATGKTQVVDKYGRFAWATPEELASHSIPVYKSGPADIDKDYRPAYIGEEELVDLIKTFLCIPNISTWDNNAKRMVPNTNVKPEDCECRLDNISNFFKGDFTEIKEALSSMPSNKMKVLLGVRTDAESGRLYQAVYTRKFLKNSANNYNSLEKEIQELVSSAATSGRVLNTEYEVVNVHEYNVEETKISPSNNEAPVVDDLPMSDPSSPWE